MNPINLDAIRQYVESNIGDFHDNRLKKLDNLQLTNVLKRKNPYLFKAKNILTSEHLIRSVLDAYLSSQEETLFGDFLEGVAIFVGEQVHNGYKPAIEEFQGLDLIFEQASNLYIVEIKSGPHWGNSSQIRNMLLSFEAAKKVLSGQYPDRTIIAVNGCCYGKDGTRSKRNGAYWKLCGQDFWRFISGDDRLYLDIIEPLGYRAKARNQAFDEAYAKIINKFTREFNLQFCESDGAIDWEKLVAFVSQRADDSTYPF